MKFEPNLCPICDEPAKSTLGSVLVDELMSYDPSTGEYDYADESEVDWNCQESELDCAGRFKLQCSSCDHDWLAKLATEQNEFEVRNIQATLKNQKIAIDAEDLQNLLYSMTFVIDELDAETPKNVDVVRQYQAVLDRWQGVLTDYIKHVPLDRSKLLPSVG